MPFHSDTAKVMKTRTVTDLGSNHACGGEFRAATDREGGVILECEKCHAVEPVVSVRAPRVEGVEYREERGYTRNLPKRLSEFAHDDP